MSHRRPEVFVSATSADLRSCRQLVKEGLLVGENSRGYIDVSDGILRDEEQVVFEENFDRNKVYTALAAQNRTSAEQVGRQRAAQIAEREKRGYWIQEVSGEWRRKS